MDSLKMYYSNIKNPSYQARENLVLVVHPPVFVLNIFDSVHFQKAEIIVLFFFVAKYYFIVHKSVSSRENTFVETNARSPPLDESIGGYYA